MQHHTDRCNTTWTAQINRKIFCKSGLRRCSSCAVAATVARDLRSSSVRAAGRQDRLHSVHVEVGRRRHRVGRVASHRRSHHSHVCLHRRRVSRRKHVGVTVGCLFTSVIMSQLLHAQNTQSATAGRFNIYSQLVISAIRIADITKWQSYRVQL